MIGARDCSDQFVKDLGDTKLTKVTLSSKQNIQQHMEI